MSKSMKSRPGDMTGMISSKPPRSEIEEVDSGLQELTNDGFSDDSSRNTSVENQLDQTVDLETGCSGTHALEEHPIPPLEDSFLPIPPDSPSTLAPESFESPVGEIKAKPSTDEDTTDSPDQKHEEIRSAPSPNGVEGGHDTAHEQRLTFVKSIRVSGPLGTNPRASSTPLRIAEYYIPSKFIHRVRPVPEISNVRINKAYELRFTENLEKKYLRQARGISYRQYITVAKLFHKVPKVELGAGFP